MSSQKQKNNHLAAAAVPPHATDLEEVIIGTMLIEPASIPEVINAIFDDVFYSAAYKAMYTAIVNLYDQNKSIDILTVVEQLKTNGQLETAGGPYGVTKTTNSVSGKGHIVDHCRIVIEKYMKREMIKIGITAANEAYDNSIDAFDLYDQTDHKVFSTQEKVLKGAVKNMAYYAATVQENYDKVKQTGILGLQTTIAPIDSTFFGLVAPDLIIVAARPGGGKTSLALSITHNLSIKSNIPGAWFSLEMDGVQLTTRLTSIDTGLPHETIRRGMAPKQQEPMIKQSLSKISNAPIYIEDKPNINIRTIRTRANILKRKHGVQYIVVDYLQLMSPVGANKQSTREQEISEISRGLKILAKELNVPVIALSQLSRAVEARADKMPILSDLRESGSIEQDADEVLFLMRPEYYDFTEDVTIGGKEYPVKNLCIGIVAKNRHGATKNIAMWFDGPTMSLSTHKNDFNYSPF